MRVRAEAGSDEARGRRLSVECHKMKKWPGQRVLILRTPIAESYP